MIRQRLRELPTVACTALAAVGLLTLALPALADVGWQPPKTIADAAESFVRNRLPTQRGRTQVVARTVDPRLKLRACAAPLDAFLPPGAGIRRSTSVGVRCAGPVAWKIYVPVTLETRVEVARLTRAVAPSHILKADDVEWVEQIQSPGSTHVQRGVNDPVGRVLRTAGGAGQPLLTGMLEPAWVVRRGERVTLSAGGRALAIRMQGEAMADGAVGQKIRAKNLSSGNIVEGIVRARGLLEIDIY